MTDHQLTVLYTYLPLKEHKYGHAGLQIVAYACANADCQEITIHIVFGSGADGWDRFKINNVAERFTLRPASSAKPQPDFIPEAIRADYLEACRIRELSPKASATLARRCLQGMIRDFCKITKATLFAEIEALRVQLDAGTAARGVTHESVDAIDVVRKLGNIGAHMEKDVNLIVDIEPGEAQVLIELIEMLFVDWYVERETRTRRLAEIQALSAQKAAELESAKKGLLSPPASA